VARERARLELSRLRQTVHPMTAVSRGPGATPEALIASSYR
jgi:hypothetical protein